MHVIRNITLIAVLCGSLIAGEKPVTKDVAWEQACGGSNISVTRVKNSIVLIDAYVEHFSEGRQWLCHYKDGKIISAVYKHFSVKRVFGEGERGFTIETEEDVVKVFHFPDHEIKGMKDDMLKDLKEVISLAKKGANKTLHTNP